MGWDGRAIHLRSQREKGGGKAFHPLQGVATEAIGAAQRQDSQSQVLAEQHTRYAAFPTPSVNTSKTLMGGSSSRDWDGWHAGGSGAVMRKNVDGCVLSAVGCKQLLFEQQTTGSYAPFHMSGHSRLPGRSLLQEEGVVLSRRCCCEQAVDIVRRRSKACG